MCAGALDSTKIGNFLELHYICPMNIIRKAVLFTITLASALMLCQPARAKGDGLTVVVIDPGHGGADAGAVRGKCLEKNINLGVGLALGRLIESACEDVTVVYTRKTDVAVDLVERGRIANRAGADLFISIHADATADAATSASGASTFIMGEDKEGKNMAEVMRENDVIRYEQDYTTKYEGFVPSSTESYIIFSLMQYSYQTRSMQFAELVQKYYKTSTPMPDRGVKRGPFLVLWKPAMPSVLTEVGFVNNEHDRRVINSADGQKRIAEAIFKAFCEYKDIVDRSAREARLAAVMAAGDTVPQQAPAEIEFCIQLCSAKKSMSTTGGRFRSFGGRVVERRIGDWYKYYLPGFSTRQQADEALAGVRKVYRDAYVVAFENGAPISAAEAQVKLNNRQ